MKSLILDCSCGMSVYVVDDEKIYSKIDNTQNKHSDEILVVIDKLLLDASISVKELDNICVCIGPGSFTGVRVAISLAKGLSIGTGAKVFVLSNFDIFDIQDAKNYYLVLDGFSNFVYVRKCDNGKILDDCVDIDDFKNITIKNNSPVFVTTEKTQNLLKKVEIQSNFAQNQVIRAFNKKNAAKENIELNQINPIYLRASQAEIERAKKK